VTAADSIDVDDYHAAVEHFFAIGWSDGLPIVPPTPELVEHMLAAVPEAPTDVIATIPPSNAAATTELIAINAVMAGCTPQMLPVVIAAVRAASAPEHNLAGVQTTTHSCVPLIIVNGPHRQSLGFNSREGVFGAGHRPNGTVGRALNLVLRNVGGNHPGVTDQATFSHPGKWAFCIAENEAESPWEPFSVARDFAASEDVVTVFSCEAPVGVIGINAPVSRQLTALADTLSRVGANNVQVMGEVLVVIASGNAPAFAAEGWSRADVQRFLWRHATRAQRDVAGLVYPQEHEKHSPVWLDRTDPDEAVPVTAAPEDIHVLVAGGIGYFNAVCAGWGGFGGGAVSQLVRWRDDAWGERSE
jgi:hypothetical protein